MVMHTALISAYSICRQRTTICHHTAWPGLEYLDADDYAVSSTSYVDFIRINCSLPDHVTRVSYKTDFAVMAIDDLNFTFYIELDDGTNQDSESAQTISIEAQPYGSVGGVQAAAERARGGPLPFSAAYDKPSLFWGLEGHVDVSNITLPDDVEIALYAKTNQSTGKMRLGSFACFWECIG